MFKDIMLIMGRKGSVSVHYDKNFSCEHDDVYVMKVNNIDTRYMYYYVKNNVKWFGEHMNGSTIKGTSKEILAKFNVNVLKPAIMKKHKLQELFDEVDKMKDTLETNKKEYNAQIDKLFDTKDVEEEKAVEVTIKTKTKKSKNKEVQEIEI
jgi:hypothetical protein